jgi:hypothetical protein
LFNEGLEVKLSGEKERRQREEGSETTEYRELNDNEWVRV